MTKIFFTADLHLKHTNLIKHGIRNFKDCEEHDNTILTNWNNKVKKGDLVYIVGDVVWGQDFSILKKFNGQKIIIKGNHDKTKDLDLAKKNNYISNWFHNKTINVNSEPFGKVSIAMNHFPMRSWDRSFYGSVLLYGHCHGSMGDYNLSTDIGVDCWNYTPVSTEEVIKYFKDKLIEFKKVEERLKLEEHTMRGALALDK